MSSLFGWGGVMIGGVEFTTAFGVLSFERVDVRNTTIAGKVLLHAKGWRPIIETELFNMNATDTANLVALTGLISQAQQSGSTLGVRPRYLSTDPGSLTSYACFIDSDYSPEDIAQVDVGQSIKLRWIGEELVNSLPTNVSNPVLSYRVFNADTDYRVTDHNDHTKFRVNTNGV
jgi:hypothetical protein